MKKLLAAMLSGLLILSLAACQDQSPAGNAPDASPAQGESADTGQNTESAGAELEIAVIGTAIYHQFGQAMKAGATDAANAYGVAFSYDGPETDLLTDKQLEMVKVAIDKNVDAIVLSATDPEAFTAELQRARDQGIVVVSMLNPVNNDIPAAFVGSGDEFAAGYVAGEKMAEALGEEGGQVGLICADQITEYSTGRRDGFVAGLTENNPNASVADIQYAEGDHLKSTDAAKAMIEAYPDLKGLFGNGEGSVVGILNAVSELSVEGRYIVVGFDSGKQQLDAIRAGTALGAVTQDPYTVGYRAVESAVQLLQGEQVDRQIDVGFFWYDNNNMNDEAILKMIYE